MDYAIEQATKRTRTAFIWSRLLGVPFWGMIYMLSVILYKNMQISPFQITLIITLKPLSALFAPYWSQWVYNRPDRMITNLVWGNILRYLPFLFIPWIHSAWIIIGAFALYMVFYRGVIPTWMELIKRNLPPLEREKLVGRGSTIDYVGTAIIPLALGVVLDANAQSWTWLFPLTASIGLLSTIFLYNISLVGVGEMQAPPFKAQLFSKERLWHPWRNAWALVKDRTGFSKFQIGFMLGGSGLMILQPTLPIFFVDVLNLSYTKMLIALTAFKGIGFALTMPIWVRLFRKWDVFRFSGTVTLLAAIFPFFLISSQLNMVFLYLAYGLYGCMQAGSDLSWNMSGPTFAKEEDSTYFSSTNILAVGIRGCIIPPIGALLYSLTNASIVMLAGASLCFLASIYFMKYNDSLRKAMTPSGD